MKRFLIIIFFLKFGAIYSLNAMLLKSKNKPTDSLGNNYIYIIPTAIGGDLFWDLNAYWFEIGYGRKLKKKQFVDLKFGIIAYSSPTKRTLLSDLNSIESNGFNCNFEHKFLLINHFYYSTNLSYQLTKTIRDGEFDKSIHQLVSTNQYSVRRDVYCLCSKFGFQFVSNKNVFIDLGLGMGLRYINSFSENKLNAEINSGYETFANKEFDKGGKFAQKISLQIKIGYNF